MESGETKKRILILTNNDVGLYKFRKELIIELLKEYDVHLSLPFGDYIEDFCQLGCIFHETPINRRGINPLEDIKLIRKYSLLTKEISPDTILTFTIKPNIYGGLVASWRRKKYLANITGLGSSIQSKSIMSKLMIYLYGKALKNASCIFFQNSENQNHLNQNIKLKAPQVLLNGSGVNLNDYSVLPYPTNTDGHLNLIFIGRIMKEKGIDELLEIAENFQESSIKYNFHIIGPMEEGYTSRIEKMINKGTIYYHGEQQNIRGFLEKSHLLIHPSYHEGMSNVMLEAAASGRPLLASDISGCREIIEADKTGLLFKKADVADIKEKLLKFASLSLEEKEQMGLKARKYVEKHFDRNEVIKKYLERIEE